MNYQYVIKTVCGTIVPLPDGYKPGTPDGMQKWHDTMVMIRDKGMKYESSYTRTLRNKRR